MLRWSIRSSLLRRCPSDVVQGPVFAIDRRACDAPLLELAETSDPLTRSLRRFTQSNLKSPTQETGFRRPVDVSAREGLFSTALKAGTVPFSVATGHARMTLWPRCFQISSFVLYRLACMQNAAVGVLQEERMCSG